jgi:hypothetical protein
MIVSEDVVLLNELLRYKQLARRSTPDDVILSKLMELYDSYSNDLDCGNTEARYCLLCKAAAITDVAALGLDVPESEEKQDG